MMTRRTTRASSRALSSRENSPSVKVIDNVQTPTTGRSTRSLNSHLPSLGLKSSTAYGTNSNAQPTRASAPKIQSDVKNFLHEILKPERDVVNSTRPSHSPSVSSPLKDRESLKTSPERSFEMETKIFKSSGLESSDIDPEEPYLILQNQVAPTQDISSDESTFEEYDVKSERSSFKSNSPSLNVGVTSNTNNFWPIQNLQKFTGRTSIWILSFFLVGVVLLLFTTTLGNLPSIMNLHKINLPGYVTRVLSADENTLIRQRLSKLELEVSRIKENIKTVDPRTVNKLEEILPEKLVLRKRDGKLELSQEFWLAILDKALTEKTFGFSHPGISPSNERVANVVVDEKWNKFLEENERRLEQFLDKNLTNRFPQLLVENETVTRTEVIDLFRRNWELNSASINERLNNIALELKHSIQDKKFQLSSISKEDLKKFGLELSKYLPIAQLQAAAHINIENALSRSDLKINHFTQYSGAIIDLPTTSPNYQFPSQAKIWMIEKIWRYMINNPVPLPNPPEEALKNWKEPGECWCTPAQAGSGFGASLGVILGNKIYPEEIVIENIQSSVSLEPGSAPKMLELFAAIENPEIESVLREQSQKRFPDLSHDLANKLDGYVRIAAWTYELDTPHHIQTHEIPLDLKAYGIGTSKLVLRMTSNWYKDKVGYICLYRVRLHGTIVNAF